VKRKYLGNVEQGKDMLGEMNTGRSDTVRSRLSRKRHVSWETTRKCTYHQARVGRHEGVLKREREIYPGWEQYQSS